MHSSVTPNFPSFVEEKKKCSERPNAQLCQIREIKKSISEMSATSIS